MKDINDAQRQGFEHGRLEGIRQGLRSVLEAKFGTRGRALLERLGECGDLFRLEALTRAAARARFVDEIQTRFALPNGNIERLRALAEPHLTKHRIHVEENTPKHVSCPEQKGIEEGITKGVLVGQIRLCQVLLNQTLTDQERLLEKPETELRALLSALRKQLSLEND